MAVKSLDPINCSAVTFLRGLGRQIAEVSGEIREGILSFSAVERVDSTLQCSSAS